MKSIWFVGIAFLVVACAKQREIHLEQKPDERGNTLELTFQKPKIDSLSRALFRLELSDDERVFWLFCSKSDGQLRADSIAIHDKKHKAKAMTIRLKSDCMFGRFDELGFSVDYDANFDGFHDVRVNNYVGAYSYSSSFWIFDAKSKQFEHVPSLDSILNPEFDAKSRRIISNWHAGLASFNNDSYIWDNGKVVLLESIRENAMYPDARNGTHFWVKRLVNGKYIENDSIAKTAD